ncbi:HAD-IA family hydrolase [Actinomadura fibrosa]|uniref:HAD-IA family hydrolase n=1 Tax=Actinomadura fibrosa TaxID=111802 RepID=A0ABW2XUC1_9ACTN|nr:HAD-IA family hydrolase [Actinomadura fibrosa]
MSTEPSDATRTEEIATVAHARPRALVIDWVGVLTTGFEPSVAAWSRSEGVPTAAVMDVLAELRGAGVGEQAGSGMIRALERGEIGAEVFERELASRLRRVSGVAVRRSGLIGRMFGHFEVDLRLLGAVRRLRARGHRTALLSNSWGNDYPGELLEGAFDQVLISGELGMRKPQPEIFRYAAGRLGVAPGESVFVDDLAANVAGAARAGMIGVLHESRAATLRALGRYFPLSSDASAAAASDRSGRAR